MNASLSESSIGSNLLSRNDSRTQLKVTPEIERMRGAMLGRGSKLDSRERNSDLNLHIV